MCATLAELWATALSAPAADDAFKRELANQVKTLSAQKVAAVSGVGGWLFLTDELRFLSVGQFWGDTAANVSRSTNPAAMDPFVAIVDFNKQLQARGVHLLLVPVPPKIAIYPERLFPSFDSKPEDLGADLQTFYRQLEKAGVEVVDLLPLFYSERTDERGPLYCRTDSHWSGLGCVLAAKAIADHVRSQLKTKSSPDDYLVSWNEITIAGDLVGLLPESSPRPEPEKISVRQVKTAAVGTVIEPDNNSPLLVIGDSHTLVFHDFLAADAGLLDQLTLELGVRPDLIGTRGSGATPVRVSLYRRSIKDPEYLSRKKVVVWCFGAREFTEAAQGWQLLPVTK